MTDFFDIHPRLLELSRQAEELCVGAFARIAENEEYNGQKVLAAFRKAGVSEAHLKGTTGYGYDDRGREGLDTIFAAVFGAEDALVRHTFVSGTHALATALFGVLRPGELLVSVTGAPYDTLEETIGIRGDSDGSLMDWGVKYLGRWSCCLTAPPILRPLQRLPRRPGLSTSSGAGATACAPALRLRSSARLPRQPRRKTQMLSLWWTTATGSWWKSGNPPRWGPT